MRCPKCGYTSFDHLDSCKKCGKDLLEFKERFGIKSVLFPGQMDVESAGDMESFDAESSDAAVAAATAATAATASATAAAVAAEDDVADVASDGDDFGFDFMGDSAEDDDLSFDELFEEAPEEEDVEESIEGPKNEASEAPEEDFSFDLPEEEDEDLDADFGFDPLDEDPGEPDKELLSTEDDEQGTEEDPKSPFDLPESSALEGAPGSTVPDSSSSAFVEETFDFGEPDRLDAVDETGESTKAEPFVFAGDSSPVVEEEEVLHPAEVQDKPAADVRVPVADNCEAGTADAHVAVAAFDSLGDSVVSETTPDDLPMDAAMPIAEGVVDLPLAAAVYPGLTGRIAAFACDLLILLLVGASFILVAEATISTDSRFLPSAETLIDLSVPYFLVLFSLAFGYFTLFHFLVGQTPGKMLAGVRVETVEGDALSFGHAFLRSVGGLLQVLPLGLGCVAILLNADRRGWNDRLAGTCIVSLKDQS